MRTSVQVLATSCWWSVALLCFASGAQAVEQAEVISPEAEELVHQLDANDLYTRQLAFIRLEVLREPGTAPAIRQYTQSRNADTRAFSLRALAAVDRAEAIPILKEHLQTDRVARVRIAALLALEPLNDPSTLPLLIGVLRDRHPHVRMAAIDVLSRIDHPDARKAIHQRWRRERNRDVRRVLEEAVERVDHPRQAKADRASSWSGLGVPSEQPAAQPAAEQKSNGY